MDAVPTAEAVAQLAGALGDLADAIRHLGEIMAGSASPHELEGASDAPDTTQVAVEQTDTMDGAEQPAPLAQPGDAVRQWLRQRGLQVREASLPAPSDDPLVRLAVELGTHFDDLVELHDRIRATHANGTQFTIRLADAPPDRISRCVAFAKRLVQVGMLQQSRYDKHQRTLIARPQQVGAIQNFFTGGWYELYVTSEILATLSDCSYDILTNVKLTMANGQESELDILCLVEGRPLLVECKTGNYSLHLERVASLRDLLQLGADGVLLAALDLPTDAMLTIPRTWRLSVADRNSLQPIVRQMLGLVGGATAEGERPAFLPPSSLPTAGSPAAMVRLERGALGAFLRRVHLRPVPDVRPMVLGMVPEVEKALPAGATPKELKGVLYQSLPDISKSAVSDALAAAVRGGALLDAQGHAVTNWMVPFDRLASTDPCDLEACARRAYIEAILRADSSWFDDRSALREFETVVGLPAPDSEEIQAARSRILEAAARPQPGDDRAMIGE